MSLSEKQQKVINELYAGTTHTGESLVDVGFTVEAAFKRLNELEEKLKSTVPVCPHCGVKMEKVFFKGYYDERSYWECDCDFENDKDAVQSKGCYS
jgi:tRNA(Ile2) C34 agmatinyltransferase TiaS